MSLLEETRVRFLWVLAKAWHRLGRYEEAANMYERILRIRPDDKQVIFHRAWWLIEVPHRRKEAIDALRRLLEASPYAFGFFLLGNALQMEGRHEEAIRAYETADSTYSPSGPHAPQFYFNWGKSLIALRRRDQAAEAFRHAALLQPSDVVAWRILGLIFAELGRWTDAVACQERVLRLEPSVTHGLELGRTLYELNRLEDAERVLREALALDPQSIDAKGMLASVFSDQERHEDAIRLAREIRAATPGALTPRLVLAGVLSWAGQLPEAFEEATGAAESAPDDPWPHHALGSIHLRMNDGHAALRDFERMAERIHSDVERLPASVWESCLAGRAAALSLLSRHDEAVAVFKEVLQIDGQFFERGRTFAPYYERSSREIIK